MAYVLVHVYNRKYILVFALFTVNLEYRPWEIKLGECICILWYTSYSSSIYTILMFGLLFECLAEGRSEVNACESFPYTLVMCLFIVLANVYS